MDPPTMSASQVLDHLYSLDTSSPDFLRVLYGLIRHDEDEQYSSSLQGSELARLVDFLDDALSTIPTTDDVFRQCLRKLRAICGCHTTLPSSHVVSGDLVKIGSHPMAFGGFADVWEGTLGGRKVCVKVLRVSLNDDQSLTKSFFEEAVVWKRLRHPNVVPFLGVTSTPLQFVSEWMLNGTLTKYVRENQGANRISLLLDVAEGLNYLHTSHTIHGDLKGPNILVDRNGRACLTDFGLASIVRGVNSDLVSQAQGYTARWTAPEILKGGGKVTREADIFSFGMVVIEVFTGKHPFSGLNSPSVIFKIMDGERPARPWEVQELGLVDSVWTMTLSCWQENPADRPATAEVVGFLRECYTLRAANLPLPASAPWQPTEIIKVTTNHTPISPIHTNGNPTPNQSPGTPQHSGQPNLQAYEISRNLTSTSDIPYPGLFPTTRGSSREPLVDVSRVPFNSATHADPGLDRFFLNVGKPDQNPRSWNDQTFTPRDGHGPPLRSATFDDAKSSQSKHPVFRTSSLPTQKDPPPVPPIGSGPNHKIGIVTSRPQSVKRGKRPQKTGKALWKGVAAAVRFMVFAKRPPAEDHGG